MKTRNFNRDDLTEGGQKIFDDVTANVNKIISDLFPAVKLTSEKSKADYNNAITRYSNVLIDKIMALAESGKGNNKLQFHEYESNKDIIRKLLINNFRRGYDKYLQDNELEIITNYNLNIENMIKQSLDQAFDQLRNIPKEVEDIILSVLHTHKVRNSKGENVPQRDDQKYKLEISQGKFEEWHQIITDFLTPNIVNYFKNIGESKKDIIDAFVNSGLMKKLSGGKKSGVSELKKIKCKNILYCIFESSMVSINDAENIVNNVLGNALNIEDKICKKLEGKYGRKYTEFIIDLSNSIQLQADFYMNNKAKCDGAIMAYYMVFFGTQRRGSLVGNSISNFPNSEKVKEDITNIFLNIKKELSEPQIRRPESLSVIEILDKVSSDNKYILSETDVSHIKQSIYDHCDEDFSVYNFLVKDNIDTSYIGVTLDGMIVNPDMDSKFCENIYLQDTSISKKELVRRFSDEQLQGQDFNLVKQLQHYGRIQEFLINYNNNSELSFFKGKNIIFSSPDLQNINNLLDIQFAAVEKKQKASLISNLYERKISQANIDLKQQKSFIKPNIVKKNLFCYLVELLELSENVQRRKQIFEITSLLISASINLEMIDSDRSKAQKYLLEIAGRKNNMPYMLRENLRQQILLKVKDKEYNSLKGIESKVSNDESMEYKAGSASRASTLTVPSVMSSFNEVPSYIAKSASNTLSRVGDGNVRKIDEEKSPKQSNFNNKGKLSQHTEKLEEVEKEDNLRKSKKSSSFFKKPSRKGSKKDRKKTKEEAVYIVPESSEDEVPTIKHLRLAKTARPKKAPSHENFRKYHTNPFDSDMTDGMQSRRSTNPFDSDMTDGMQSRRSTNPFDNTLDGDIGTYNRYAPRSNASTLIKENDTNTSITYQASTIREGSRHRW